MQTIIKIGGSACCALGCCYRNRPSPRKPPTYPPGVAISGLEAGTAAAGTAGAGAAVVGGVAAGTIPIIPGARTVRITQPVRTVPIIRSARSVRITVRTTPPYYSSMYLYNPIYNPGLVARSPWARAEALTLANWGTMNAYSYMWNYDASLNSYAANQQNQQAMMQNYYAQLYQQEAMNQYVQAANLTTYAAYTALQAQQYQNSMSNPYGVVPAVGNRACTAAHSVAVSEVSIRFHRFGGNHQPGYDPFATRLSGVLIPANVPPASMARPGRFSLPTARCKLGWLRSCSTRFQTTSTPGEIIAWLGPEHFTEGYRQVSWP